jgi:CRISPR-associated protein Csx14
LVDILATIGLTHARPYFVKKLEYRYGILTGQGHRALFLRAALGGTLEAFPRRQFQIQLGWPGKEGQARAIVGVTEVANQKESAS